MSIDEQHVALPKLYGAPAYARPAPAVDVADRPFDPDDLPLEAFQTDDERESGDGVQAHTWTSAGSDELDGDASNGSAGTGLRGRPFRLRSIAGRLLGGD